MCCCSKEETPKLKVRISLRSSGNSLGDWPEGIPFPTSVTDQYLLLDSGEYRVSALSWSLEGTPTLDIIVVKVGE